MTKLTINNDSAVQQAVRALNDRAQQTATLTERLSSGMRINQASDDAAGLSVASQLMSGSQISARALRNVNDGISAANIADSALTALTSITTRLSELATEAANGTLTQTQRLAVTQEANANVEEFNRIVQSVNFNGQNLLDPNNPSMGLQVGPDSGDSITLQLNSELGDTVGNGNFTAPSTFSTGLASAPNSIVMADVNGDGIADAVVSNAAAASVSILLGNSDGTFKAATTVAIATNASQVAAADLNNDGKIDLVTSDYGQSGLGTTNSILLGNGDGTFSAYTTIGAGIGPTGVTLGDFNNDGKIDIISGTAGTNFVSGLSEISTGTASTNGTTNITDVTLSALQTLEASQITTAAVGTPESTNFTMVAAPTQEVTQITAAAPSIQEQTTIGTIAASTREVTQITLPGGASITGGHDFTLSGIQSNGTSKSYNVWYKVDGVGSSPGGNAIEVDITSAMTASQVADATRDALNGAGGEGNFSVSSASGTITVTNTRGGSVTDAADVNIGGSFSRLVTTQGVTSALAQNDYFLINAPTNTGATNQYYVWFNIGGEGVDPGVAGKTGIQVNINWDDSATAVATAVRGAIGAVSSAFTAGGAGTSVVVTNVEGGSVTDASDNNVGGAFSVTTNTQGTATGLANGKDMLISAPDSTGTQKDYYVWFNVGGTGVDPAVAGKTGIEVDLGWADNSSTVATKIAIALSAANTVFASAAPFGSTVVVTNKYGGNVTDASVGNITGTFATSTTTQGVTTSLASGDNFLLNAPDSSGNSQGYYVWYNLGGTGSDPAIGGRTGIEVDAAWGASATTLAAATRDAINTGYSSTFTASAAGSVTTVTNKFGNSVVDASDGNIGAGFSASVTTQGVDSGYEPGDFFTITTPSGQNFQLWFKINGQGSAPGGGTPVEVDVSWGDSANTVATAISTALAPYSANFTVGKVGNVVTVTNKAPGSAADITDNDVGGAFSVSTLTQGTDSGITNSSYFSITAPDTNGNPVNYYVWYNIGGTGVNPSPGGTGIQVTGLNFGDSADTVATRTAAAINGVLGLSASNIGGGQVRVTDSFVGTASFGAGTILGSSFINQQAGTPNPIVTGQYFTFHEEGGQGYYVWYDNGDGAGSDPALGGYHGIRAAITKGMTGAQVAAATAAAITADGLASSFFTASAAGATFTITDKFNNDATNIANISVGGLVVSTVQDGVSTRVDPAANTVTVPNHGFTTGKVVQLVTNGTLPGGLNTGTTYYLIVVDANTVKFASSLANAMAGTAIDITSFGVGTHSIIASSTSSGTYVNFGNGNGTFGNRTTLDIGPIPTNVVTADVNGDGNLDLLITEASSNTLEVALGFGNGSFSAYKQYAVGTNPSAVALADLNLDGNLDAVVTNQGANGAGTTISVLYGNSDGSFGASKTLATTATGPVSVVLGDINGDGRPDIVSGLAGNGTGNTLDVFLNQGNQTFSAAQSFNTGTNPGALALQDINNDGVLDIVSANQGDGDIGVLSGVTKTVSTMPYLNLSTQQGARTAVDTIAQTSERVLAQLGSIGAQESRLQFTSAAVTNLRDEYEEAYHRIMDDDTAQTSADYIRLTILQQSTEAVLAHAKLQGSVVLQLLK